MLTRAYLSAWNSAPRANASRAAAATSSAAWHFATARQGRVYRAVPPIVTVFASPECVFSAGP